jgi:hypothetical protein
MNHESITSRTHLDQLVHELAPELYEERRLILGRAKGVSDMSHGNQCQHLSFDMNTALKNRGTIANREYHENGDGNWHYLLAHTFLDEEPSDDDLITDLNPWQGLGNNSRTGLLHGRRAEVMDQMFDAGVPEHLVALRGIATIRKRHAENR